MFLAGRKGNGDVPVIGLEAPQGIAVILQDGAVGPMINSSEVRAEVFGVVPVGLHLSAVLFNKGTVFQHDPEHAAVFVQLFQFIGRYGQLLDFLSFVPLDGREFFPQDELNTIALPAKERREGIR